MDITKHPQFHLYLLTLHFLMIKNQLIPENSNERWTYGTIINRAYYSAYLYCELWLEKIKNFKVKPPWEFKPNEKKIGEHKQVRKALFDFGEEETETELKNLASLRKKADYHPYEEITEDKVTNAIQHMKKIFSHLKFE
ncbi:hypothetical protein [Methanobrevibacter sp.]|uniref:hypothetical protein n=1 Tax=Methanobrevibacter sp. TaxID=66852 RepID=UPI0038907297